MGTLTGRRPHHLAQPAGIELAILDPQGAGELGIVAPTCSMKRAVFERAGL